MVSMFTIVILGSQNLLNVQVIRARLLSCYDC